MDSNTVIIDGANRPSADSSKLVLCVRNWAERFETSESRKLKSQQWVPLKNDLSDPWYVTVMQRDDGPEILGTWAALLMVASRCHKRGTFADSYGHAYTLATIASVCRIRLELVTKTVDLLTLQIPWLEWQTIIPDDSAGSPATAPVIPSSAAAAVVASSETPSLNGMEGNGKKEGNSRNSNGEFAAAAVAGNSPCGGWEEARPIAREIALAITGKGMPVRSDHREWCAKVAILAVRYGRQWLAPALEGIRNVKPRDPVAYASKILDGECERMGTRLQRELSTTQVPPEALRPPVQRAMEPTSAGCPP